MRIALVSDAWAPQVNGVVRTLTATVDELRRRGHVVETITPDGFRTVPCPTYPDIRLAIGCGNGVVRRLQDFKPDAVHIATEGPLGWAARRWCLEEDHAFSTSFHTRFADYLALRTRLPARLFWPAIRRFHAPAGTVFTATDALATELAAHGLHQTRRWSRGVDLSLFTPNGPQHAALAALPRPLQLYVGRVAIEKNIQAFLSLETSGTKLVVGDGPARTALEKRHPEAHFVGPLHGAALASVYRAADVLVFPSLTDTFGLVMIEALACGTPVAAFPVRGPLDVIGEITHGRSTPRIGAMDGDLASAIAAALTADRTACAAEGARYNWGTCTDQFVAGLRPIAHFTASPHWPTRRPIGAAA